MFIVAAKAVAEQVTQDELDSGLIYPPQSQILNASLRTATKIAEYIFEQGLARVKKPKDIEAHIRSMAYKPTYES
jgi:malate dehydrogenase (oxaloacetate-decarboxylating)(NADP+)